MNRRSMIHFLAGAVVATVAGLFRSSPTWAGAAQAASPKIADGSVKGSPPAAFFYAKNSKDVAKLKPKNLPAYSKWNPPAKPGEKPPQVCTNCNFYREHKNAGFGTCILLAGYLVHDPGWCNMWTKKA